MDVPNKILYGLGGVLLIVIIGLCYLGYQNYLLTQTTLTLEQGLRETENALSSTKANLFSASERVKVLQGELSVTRIEQDILEDDLLKERGRMDLLAGHVRSVTDAVGVIEKTNRVDPQLLQKYSKVYFLNENYVPSKLVRVDPPYTFDVEEEFEIHAAIWPFLKKMMDDARTAGTDIQVISAYRSFGTQADLKSSYRVTYGVGTANQFSADQGYSEHQLATTIDFTTSAVGAAYSGFDKTRAYTWLTENASRYGFILSYPKGNSYYVFEPWHWRFVGKELAGKLQLAGRHFYDLDQREIDTYRTHFFDK